MITKEYLISKGFKCLSNHTVHFPREEQAKVLFHRVNVIMAEKILESQDSIEIEEYACMLDGSI